MYLNWNHATNMYLISIKGLLHVLQNVHDLICINFKNAFTNAYKDLS